MSRLTTQQSDKPFHMGDRNWALLVVDAQARYLMTLSKDRQEEFPLQLRDLITIVSDVYNIPAIVVGLDAYDPPIFYGGNAMRDERTRQQLVNTYGLDAIGLRSSDMFQGKDTPGAFWGSTDLAPQLWKRKINGIIVCGMHTSACVVTTINEGVLRDFDCVALTDHMADDDEPASNNHRWHEAVLKKHAKTDVTGELRTMTLPGMLCELDEVRTLPHARRPKPMQNRAPRNIRESTCG